MFDLLTSARRSLRQFNETVDPDAVSPIEAKAAIESLAEVEKLAAGAKLLLLRCLEPDAATVDWLGRTTGRTKRDAERDVEAAQQVKPSTDRALRDGELSAEQAREVASAADADPGAEQGLLDTARNASVSELQRKAKKTRGAATDDAEKERRARKERALSTGVDEETGKGWWHLSGPAAEVARMNAALEPFVQAEFDKARREGRHETRGAYAFDALKAALGLASTRRTGTTAETTDQGVRPPARILVRVDATAMKRGRTVAGETCEIDGLGPVPVAALRELLPDAAIELIVTNGENVWNITHLGRRANAHQQVVLDWLGGECSREGCGATRNLQVDHRIDWATIHITELMNLDWMCVREHRLKTHHGWALVPGKGKRRMVPPDDPDHPANTRRQLPPANSPPAADAA